MLANFRSRLKNKEHAVLFVLFLLPIIWIKWVLPNPDSHNIQLLQERFNEQQKHALSYAKELNSAWKKGSVQEFDAFCEKADNSFFVHVFRNDSLIYWNSNEFPISRFADLHFPVSGLVQLQNGWYYTQLSTSKNLVIAVSFGIQHQYPYLNEHLKNNFFEPFTDEHFQIDPESSSHVLLNAKGDKLVGLRINEQVTQHQAPLIWLFVFVMLEFIVVWHFLRQRLEHDLWRTLLGFGIVALHFICLRYNPFEWLENTELTDSGVLALGEWIPNMLELILWSLMGLLFTYSLWPVLRKKISSKAVVFSSLIIMPSAIVLLPFLGSLLIENSSVPLELTNVLHLDYDSVFILFLFGCGGLYFIQLSYFALKGAKLITNKNPNLYLVYLALIIAISTVFAFTFLEENRFIICWPLSLFLTVAFLIARRKGIWSFSMILFTLVLFATATTVNINFLSELKEKEAREIYAKNLAMEQDINTEIEFTELKQKMVDDDYCNRFFDSSIQPSSREVKEAFEHRFFNGYWDQYDLDCYYFSKEDDSTQKGDYNQAELNELISRAGVVSEIDPDLYSIEDDQSQFVYCFRVPIINPAGSDTVMLFGGLKSKRIPEEIGFPRLLISESTNVFEALSDYSISKYLDDRLIRNEGEADYPTNFRKLSSWDGIGIHWIETEGMSHVVYKKSKRNALVLSRNKPDIMDSVTAIAFLVVAYGVLLLLTRLIILQSAAVQVQLTSLATRIQLVMIGLVVASLIGFSVGSGTFVQRQYDDYSKDIIRQKLRSLHAEAMNNRSLFRANTSQRVTKLEDQLIAWGRTFQTDINFFLPDGYLVASSRPKLYNIGLLSEQIHPGALRVMKYEGKAESILQEKIGTLSFYSAYIPLNSPDGHFLGYLNVQHFAQQGAFESQLQRFFVAILNVFMLLLVLSIVGAVFVSSWITAPLRMIRKSVSNVAFGRHNEQIVYSSNDEIGSLVAEYNHKLTELEDAAMKLAQTEREEAWREMAKQVAHEIKNPLTPMKLSVQHLQRAFDPSDPNAEQKIQKVSAALIEQIDALTTIANAFSSFAKLPQPKIQSVDLVEVLRNVVQLFENEDALVTFSSNVKSCTVSADKEMLVRVFNNIVTNGIQSVEYGKQAVIAVELNVVSNSVLVSIRDNGTGIPEEQLTTIFEPYFTTKSTGTGLGLAMVKQLVELHEGSIQITETSEKGSTFVVTLPV